jgi:hypothetical protein
MGAPMDGVQDAEDLRVELDKMDKKQQGKSTVSDPLPSAGRPRSPATAAAPSLPPRPIAQDVDMVKVEADVEALRALAKQGKVQEAVDGLLAIEKQGRVAEDVPSTRLACTTILQVGAARLRATTPATCRPPATQPAEPRPHPPPSRPCVGPARCG